MWAFLNSDIIPTSQEACHIGALNSLCFPTYNILAWVSRSKVDSHFSDEEMFKESRVIYSLENPDGSILIDEIRRRKNN